MRFTASSCSRLPAICGAFVALAAVAGCEVSSDQPVSTAPPFACAPRYGGAMGLSGEWQSFGTHIDECSLRAANGEVALRIVTVSAARFYAGKPDGATTGKLPRPLILSATGKKVGHLPYSYPDDPPLSATLAFDAWRNEIPGVIRIAVHDPAVTGDHELVMTWDDSKRTYTSLP